MRILLGIFAIVALGCSYFYFNFVPAAVEDISMESIAQDRVSVPILVSPKINSEVTTDFNTALFEDATLGFSFMYRVNSDAYSIILQPTAGASYLNLLAMYSVVKTADYNQMINNSAKGIYYGSPSSVGIQVYDAAGALDINTWLLENSMSTNCEADTILDTTVAGIDAASCQWNGMYEGITVGLLFDNKVYMLTGTRDENQNGAGYSNYGDFKDLVSSFRVI